LSKSITDEKKDIKRPAGSNARRVHGFSGISEIPGVGGMSGKIFFPEKNFARRLIRITTLKEQLAQKEKENQTLREQTELIRDENEALRVALDRFVPSSVPRPSEVLRDAKQRLAPAKIAQHFALTLPELAHSLTLSPSDLSPKVSASLAGQAKLEVYARIMDILASRMRTWDAAQKWLKRSNPSFDEQTPYELLKEGHTDILANYLESVAAGEYS